MYFFVKLEKELGAVSKKVKGTLVQEGKTSSKQTDEQKKDIHTDTQASKLDTQKQTNKADIKTKIEIKKQEDYLDLDQESKVSVTEMDILNQPTSGDLIMAENKNLSFEKQGTEGSSTVGRPMSASSENKAKDVVNLVPEKPKIGTQPGKQHGKAC